MKSIWFTDETLRETMQKDKSEALLWSPKADHFSQPENHQFETQLQYFLPTLRLEITRLKNWESDWPCVHIKEVQKIFPRCLSQAKVTTMLKDETKQKALRITLNNRFRALEELTEEETVEEKWKVIREALKQLHLHASNYWA